MWKMETGAQEKNFPDFTSHEENIVDVSTFKPTLDSVRLALGMNKGTNNGDYDAEGDRPLWNKIKPDITEVDNYLKSKKSEIETNAETKKRKAKVKKEVEEDLKATEAERAEVKEMLANIKKMANKSQN